ncbi:MAG: RNA polymerase-associated protein RapA [Opitutaceae bacterium]
MSLNLVGQRCVSETEPELGLGIVVSIGRHQIGIDFPGSGEKRLYAPGTPILKRVRFRAGETIRTTEGALLVIESIEEVDGLLVYLGNGMRVREDAISDQNLANGPLERLMQGQMDPLEVFDLRTRCLEGQAAFRQSPVRGYLGGRIDLIPHQFYILNEVASRQIPRVLLADEVGLGKTIEACLILQRLLATGMIRRILILVPEPLVHQWFVELLRRFNLWFSIFDEERCHSLEHSLPDSNPFLDEQLALCSIAFPAGNEIRRAQILEGDWDMVVVDEAHHLDWTPERSSPEYDLVDQLASKALGLLLLTATPTQLGMTGHFARLRLLDPDRYGDLETYLNEAKNYAPVAKIVGRILEAEKLTAADQKDLKRIFKGDEKRLGRLLDEMKNGKAEAKNALLRSLLDEHGTGRVVFRNTRTAMTGFPKRAYSPAPIDNPSPTLIKRMNREFEAEATGHESDIRYSFSDDPRIDWLVGLLKELKEDKVLLICHSRRKAMALESAIKEVTNLKIALFHEEQPLVSRDRQAAWFAEPDGARLLISSEIGSEGRNFQFAHHLVLFDLPMNPGLLEQRIGRLDRIGQTRTIRIHFPYLKGSAQEYIQDWYHQGLDAFETLIHSGTEYEAAFRDRVIGFALDAKAHQRPRGQVAGERLITETIRFRKALTKRMQEGRDRLLELNSFNPEIAEAVIGQVRQADRDPRLRDLLFELMEHFGVRIVEHEDGDVFLDPSHAYVEAFPSLPREGTLATFDRTRAIQREDITFLTSDHRILQDTLDLLLNSPTGTVCFCTAKSTEPNILLEAIYQHESVSRVQWHVERFLPPTPVRVVVDIRGNDLSTGFRLPETTESGTEPALRQLLDSGGLNLEVMKSLLGATTRAAEKEAEHRKVEAGKIAVEALGTELQRLIDLRKINDHVRPEEITLARSQLNETLKAITKARLRLDSIRLILMN